VEARPVGSMRICACSAPSATRKARTSLSTALLSSSRSSGAKASVTQPRIGESVVVEAQPANQSTTPKTAQLLRFGMLTTCAPATCAARLETAPR
jgi:hypothetical protein